MSADGYGGWCTITSSHPWPEMAVRAPPPSTKIRPHSSGELASVPVALFEHLNRAGRELCPECAGAIYDLVMPHRGRVRTPEHLRTVEAWLEAVLGRPSARELLLAFDLAGQAREDPGERGLPTGPSWLSLHRFDRPSWRGSSQRYDCRSRFRGT